MISIGNRTVIFNGAFLLPKGETLTIIPGVTGSNEPSSSLNFTFKFGDPVKPSGISWLGKPTGIDVIIEGGEIGVPANSDGFVRVGQNEESFLGFFCSFTRSSSGLDSIHVIIGSEGKPDGQN